ncbi:hypothetical protein CW714_02470, partial [Methanophagales archaeon]
NQPVMTNTSRVSETMMPNSIFRYGILQKNRENCLPTYRVTKNENADAVSTAISSRMNARGGAAMPSHS